jgi:hypothetical protein
MVQANWRIFMDDFEALSSIVSVLKELDSDTQKRVLKAVQTFLGLEPEPGQIGISSFSPTPSEGDFSRDRTLSAKEFLSDKHPQTDVERVICLAYYLTHYRDTPHFKTVDISALNTEAAQPKFSNTAVAVDNARKSGYLVAATKGNKQISAVAEKFVELLPDREAARDAVRTFGPRRKTRKAKTPRSKTNASKASKETKNNSL